jgi:hypothetical protein
MTHLQYDLCCLPELVRVCEPEPSPDERIQFIIAVLFWGVEGFVSLLPFVRERWFYKSSSGHNNQ